MSRRATPYALLVAAAGAVATVAACDLAVGTESPPPRGTQTVVNGADATVLDAGPVNTDFDASIDAAPASPYQGNPLCNASRATGCYPDDPITPMTAAACSADAGAGDSGGALACHVESTAGGVGAVCLPAGSGMDGDPCSGPTDCASGFECVASGYTPRCRPYCCSGQSRCAADDDAGGAGEFCDIQPTQPGTTAASAVSTKVPVCMPIHKCSLSLQVTQAAGVSHNCGPDETCAVVRDDGATSCVGVGTVMAGEPCDKDHCAADLVCLGTPGQRLCYKLCTTQASTLPVPALCPPAQMCKGGLPLFPDTNDIGICE